MNKRTIIAYSILPIVLLRILISFPADNVSNALTVLNNKYLELESIAAEYQMFDDSIAGNTNYRKRILDSASKVNGLMAFRENQRKALEIKLDEFKILVSDRESLLAKDRIYEVIKVILDILFVIAALLTFTIWYRRT